MERRTRTQLALGLFLILVAAFLAALRLYPPLPHARPAPGVAHMDHHRRRHRPDHWPGRRCAGDGRTGLYYRWNWQHPLLPEQNR